MVYLTTLTTLKDTLRILLDSFDPIFWIFCKQNIGSNESNRICINNPWSGNLKIVFLFLKTINQSIFHNIKHSSWFLGVDLSQVSFKIKMMLGHVYRIDLACSCIFLVEQRFIGDIPDGVQKRFNDGRHPTPPLVCLFVLLTFFGLVFFSTLISTNPLDAL